MRTRRIRQAVVLAGGFGTRLGELTRTTPKPLLPVGGKPFIAWLIEWLARAGFDDIILSTGYLAEQFDGFLETNVWQDPHGERIRVTTFRENQPAGTAGALALMAERLDQRFLLVNGDSLLLCDPVLTASFAESLPDGHMVLTTRPVDDTVRYGRVDLADNADGKTVRITGFREKGVTGPGHINSGISALDRSVLDMIGALPCSIENEIYPQLAAQGRLHGVAQSGFFTDIGLPETYEAAQHELPAAFRRPAVFFDRDGVLNVDDGYTHRVEDLRLMPGAAGAVARARRAGYQTVVVTNQAGIARGLYDEAAMHQFNRALNDELRKAGGWIDWFGFCPFHPDGTVAAYRGDHPDRKPAPGMLLRAAAQLGIDMTRSVLIGDKPSDVEAAERAGIRGVLLGDEAVDAALAPHLAG